MVILDTCAIIEMCRKKISFSKKTRTIIEQGAYILSISFAEIACKVAAKKLAMSATPKRIYEEIAEISHFEIVKIGVEEWLEAVSLNWKGHKDPADRVITAFAIKNEAPLVTTDQHIKQFYSNIIW